MENNRLPKMPYSMQLHEVVVVQARNAFDDGYMTVMRVPGGWIYKSVDKSQGLCTSVFVPYSNEYAPEYSFK